VACAAGECKRFQFVASSASELKCYGDYQAKFFAVQGFSSLAFDFDPVQLQLKLSRPKFESGVANFCLEGVNFAMQRRNGLGCGGEVFRKCSGNIDEIF
jgi:hypothetical protein